MAKRPDQFINPGTRFDSKNVVPLDEQRISSKGVSRGSSGIADAPVDGVQYARQDGLWVPVAVSSVDGNLSVGGTVTAFGNFVTLADPDSSLDVGNRSYNDDRYAGSTETWYRLNNTFAADNAVQVYLSSGIKDDFGPRLFTRSSDRLYPTRSGRWMYAVAAFFEDVSNSTNRSNRMLSIRKNGATVVRNNYGDNEAGAMTIHCTVVLDDSDYLAVEVRFGFATDADVYLQVTNMGPI